MAYLKFLERFILAATAEYLCHRLDPSWQLRRAQRQLYVPVDVDTERAQDSLIRVRDVASWIGEKYMGNSAWEITRADGGTLRFEEKEE